MVAAVYVMTVSTVGTVFGIAGVTDGMVDCDPDPVVETSGAEDESRAREEIAALDADDDPALEEDDESPGQLRSYNGVVLRVLPTTPKLGLGVFGKAS